MSFQILILPQGNSKHGDVVKKFSSNLLGFCFDHAPSSNF